MPDCLKGPVIPGGGDSNWLQDEVEGAEVDFHIFLLLFDISYHKILFAELGNTTPIIIINKK